MLFPEQKQIAERLLAQRAAFQEAMSSTDLSAVASNKFVVGGCVCAAVAAVAAVGGILVANSKSVSSAANREHSFFSRWGGSADEADHHLQYHHSRGDAGTGDSSRKSARLASADAMAAMENSSRRPSPTRPLNGTQEYHSNKSSSNLDVSNTNNAVGARDMLLMSGSALPPANAHTTPAEARFMAGLESFGHVEQSVRMDESGRSAAAAGGGANTNILGDGFGAGVAGGINHHSHQQQHLHQQSSGEASMLGMSARLSAMEDKLSQRQAGGVGSSSGYRSGLGFFSAPEEYSQQRM